MSKFEDLLVEAQSLGIQYTGEDVDELFGFISLAKADVGREHPVPCFGIKFDPTDPRCRICQLKDPCADKDNQPRVEVLEAKLSPVPCESCGKGDLEIECIDDYGALRDYACTTKGCPNSVAIQCGWEFNDDLEDESAVTFDEPEVKQEPVTVKAAPKKKATPKKAPPKKASKKDPKAGTGLIFKCGVSKFSTISAVVKHILKGKKRGYKQFFKIDQLPVSGDVLEVDHGGKHYTVEVIDA